MPNTTIIGTEDPEASVVPVIFTGGNGWESEEYLSPDERLSMGLVEAESETPPPASGREWTELATELGPLYAVLLREGAYLKKLKIFNGNLERYPYHGGMLAGLESSSYSSPEQVEEKLKRTKKSVLEIIEKINDLLGFIAPGEVVEAGKLLAALLRAPWEKRDKVAEVISVRLAGGELFSPAELLKALTE